MIDYLNKDPPGAPQILHPDCRSGWPPIPVGLRQLIIAIAGANQTWGEERFADELVTVLHSGVCVPRQYASFAGTAYGHNVTKFFDKLGQRDFATACDCLHALERRARDRGR